MFNLNGTQANNAVGTTSGVAGSNGSVDDLLQSQLSQGMQLARIQAQSSMIGNLVEAANAVARNIRAG